MLPRPASRRAVLPYLAALVLLAPALTLVSARPAAACSCGMLRDDPVGMLASGDAAFVGRVVDAPAGNWGRGPGDQVTFRFRVEWVVKGTLWEEVDVHTASDGAACGLELGAGERVGLVLRGREDHWASGLCQIVDAERLLAAVGGRPPVPGLPPNLEAERGASRSLPLFALGAAAVVAVTALVVVLERRRSGRGDPPAE